VQNITHTIHANCDLLWFSPFGFGSHYSFTGLRPATGLFAEYWPAFLDREQQIRVVANCRQPKPPIRQSAFWLTPDGHSCCKSNTDMEPLVKFVCRYTFLIGQVGSFTIQRDPATLH
jgi:hypothetical protein